MSSGAKPTVKVAASERGKKLSDFPHLVAELHPTENGDVKPECVAASTHTKLLWECHEGHIWPAQVRSRVQGQCCPYCSGRTPINGQTDMATTHPHLAAEFDREKNFPLTPESLKAGTGKRLWWRCREGHEWEVSGSDRAKGTGCDVCFGRTCAPGDTDMATTHPHLAAEFDRERNFPLTPENIVAGTRKIINWVCEEGHSWTARGSHRANYGTGCPTCTSYGFSPNDPGYLYLLENESAGLRKIGITNDVGRRSAELEKCGFRLLDVQGPFSNGQQARDWEQAILRHLRSKGAVFACDLLMDRFDGWTESWLIDSYPISSIADLKSSILCSGIEIDLQC